MPMQAADTQQTTAPEEQITNGKRRKPAGILDPPAATPRTLFDEHKVCVKLLSQAEMQLADLENFVESGFSAQA